MGRAQDLRLPANESRIGKVSNDIHFVDVNFTADTSAYAASDLIANATELNQVTSQGLEEVELVSVTLYDADDQGAALTLVLSTASTSFGTLNAAPSLADADALNIVGAVALATTDYVDVGGSKIGFKNNVGALMRTNATGDLYAALINGAGTPTFTAAGLKAKLGFRRHGA